MSTVPTHAPARHAGAILAVLCSAQIMVILDGTIVNVSLASIAEGLSLSPSEMQGVVTVYVTVLGGFLLLGGRCADLFGRRRMLIAGVLVFSAASAFAALAQNPWELLLARGLQGLAGAFLTTAALSELSSVFAEGPARNRALGVWAALGGVGSAIGVVLGGVLSDGPGWRWIFWINVPVGVAVAVTAMRLLPEGRSDDPKRMDVPGAVTLTGGLLLLVMGISRAETIGWWTVATGLTLAASVIVLVAFVMIESRTTDPLVDLHFLRRRSVRATNVTALMVYGSMTMFFYVASLLIQQVYGYSPMKTGFGYLPLALTVLVGAQASARLIQRAGVRALLVAGLTMTAIGFLLMARVPAEAHYARDLLGPFIIVGIGLGAAIVPIQVAAFRGIAQTETGLAAGLLETSRQVGGALAVAVFSTIAVAWTTRLADGGTDDIAALHGGFRVALVLGAALQVVAIAVAWFAIGRDDAPVPPAASSVIPIEGDADLATS